MKEGAERLQLSIIESVAGRLNGFFYRCRNDAHYTVMFMSDGIECLTGYPATDFINNRVRSFAAIDHPEDAPRVESTVMAALERKEKWEVDHRLICADGKSVWVHESGAGIFGEGDELLFLEGALIDISPQKAQEEKLEQLVTSISAASNDIIASVQRILGELHSLKLLALNARIEAARAGEQGAGFAVVAQEMTALADVTRSEADQIRGNLDSLQGLLMPRT